MAAGFMKELGQDRVEVLSAGSAPKDSINQVALKWQLAFESDLRYERRQIERLV